MFEDIMKQKLTTAFIVAVALVGAFKFGSQFGYANGERSHGRDVSGSLVMQCRSNIADADVQEALVTMNFSKKTMTYGGKVQQFERAQTFLNKSGAVAELQNDTDYAQVAITNGYARLVIFHGEQTVNHMQCHITGDVS